MKSNQGTSLMAGLVATLVNLPMMYFVSPYEAEPMDIAAPLEAWLGGSWTAGTVAHLMVGALVLPALYARFVCTRLPGIPAARGVAWGVFLWIVTQVVVVPAMGAGFFAAWSGGFAASMSSLIVHLIYGLVFGVLAGGPRRAVSYPRYAFRTAEAAHAG